ncbi:SGNH/GDSL hydrolase family protein [Streptomyces luteolus]|uniref:SGNH/GDSL hydrolase family protein n=1 Tax=Streptomyces luteolus TaxID=3043615 RepID=A0ABT6T533_9ACTN|nr:SGNH/GDSL hydrolase family protein [Streptomyces sp. B-S-A12]MDI3422951.1 SGNH/GDSL hydrolase family protein [Streptomyces sp. B-S-A12]
MTTASRRAVGHPVESYAALGDCLAAHREGPGRDAPFPDWADRLAVLLAEERPDGVLRYRKAAPGRSLDHIVAEQLTAVREFAPDLVALRAGGLDLLRPDADPDALAERLETAVAELCAPARTVLLFTGIDPRPLPVPRHARAKAATYTAHLRAIADRHGCPVADLWSLRALRESRAWDEGGLRLSDLGHRQIAAEAARALGLHHTVSDGELVRTTADGSRTELRRPDTAWLRDYLAPWLARPPRPRTGPRAAPRTAPRRGDETRS